MQVPNLLIGPKNLFSRNTYLNNVIVLTILLAMIVALFIMSWSQTGLEHYNILPSSSQNEVSLIAPSVAIGSVAIENNNTQETVLKTASLSLLYENVLGTDSLLGYQWFSQPISHQYFPDKRTVNWLYPVLHQSRYIS